MDCVTFTQMILTIFRGINFISYLISPIICIGTKINVFIVVFAENVFVKKFNKYISIRIEKKKILEPEKSKN